MKPHDELNDITGVILAGGRSSRMGRDKAVLKVDGVPLFQRMLRTLQALFPHVLIAGDRKDLTQPGVPCYADPFPGSSLGGIYTGLFFAKTAYVFVAPCDMPFPDLDLIQLIVSKREGFDVVIPKTLGGLERCFALYGRSCLEPIRRMLEKGEYRIEGLYSIVKVRYLNVDELPAGWERSLKNVNTPEEYCSIKESSE